MKKKPDKTAHFEALQALLDRAKATEKKEDIDQFFSALYEYYFTVAFSLTTYYKPNFVEDITQEVFIKFVTMDIQKIPDIIHGKFEKYFITACINYCRTFHRLQHHKNINLELNPSIADHRINNFEIYFEVESEVEYYLSLLPNVQKQIFELFIKGFSYKEIANTLEVPHIYVRNNLERGRKKLRKLRNA